MQPPDKDWKTDTREDWELSAEDRAKYRAQIEKLVDEQVNKTIRWRILYMGFAGFMFLGVVIIIFSGRTGLLWLFVKQLFG